MATNDYAQLSPNCLKALTSNAGRLNNFTVQAIYSFHSFQINFFSIEH